MRQVSAFPHYRWQFPSLTASSTKEVPDKECTGFVLTHSVQTQWQFFNAHSGRKWAKSETQFLKECIITEQGDHRNVSRPLARIHSTNQHTQTQTTKVRLIKLTLKESTVIESCRLTFTFDLIWPLTCLCDLWPQNIMEANIGHLPTNFGYKQAYGWKVINRNKSHGGKLSHLTFDPRIL